MSTSSPSAEALQALAKELARLRDASGLSFKQLTVEAKYSAAVLCRATKGQKLPTWEVTRALTEACGGDVDVVSPLWQQASREKRPSLIRKPTGVLRGPLVRRAGFALSLVLVAAMGVAIGMFVKGDSEPPKPPTPDKTATAPEASSRAEARSDVVVVMGPWNAEDQREKDMIEEVLERFSQDNLISYAYMRPPVQKKQDFADYYLSEQSRPDVTLMPQPGLMRCAKANNQIKILPAEVANAVNRGQADSWIDKGKIDRAPYGVVFKTGNKSRVWYNRELLAAAGVDPASLEAWTWEQFLKTVSTLRSNLGLQRPALAIGAVGNKWVLTDWFENIYARVVGGAYEDLAKPKADAWKSQDVLDTLEKMKELMGPQKATSAFDMTRGEALKRLQDGTVAMIVGDFAKDLVDKEKFDSVPFPADEGSNMVIYGADIAVMNRDNSNARALLKFLGSATAATMVTEGGYSSPRNDSNDSTTTDLFDLSDQLPSDFGSQPGRGMQGTLENLLKDHRVTAKAARDALATEVQKAGSSCTGRPTT